jgi:hypothetical protein
MGEDMIFDVYEGHEEEDKVKQGVRRYTPR